MRGNQLPVFPGVREGQVPVPSDWYERAIG